MDTVDEDILNSEGYKSPEPEVYVPSTQGPQFSDLFATPSQPPVFHNESPTGIDEPDEVTEENVILNDENQAEDFDFSTVKNAKEIEEVTSTSNNHKPNGEQKKSEEPFLQKQEQSNNVAEAIQPPQTLPLSQMVVSNGTGTFEETSATTKVENVEVQLVSPSDVNQQQSVLLSDNTEKTDSECLEEHTVPVSANGDAVVESDQHPNFSSLLTANSNSTHDEDEFDFETPVPATKLEILATAKPQVENTESKSIASEHPITLETNKTEDYRSPPEITSPAVTIQNEQDKGDENELPVVRDNLEQAQDEWATVQTIVPDVQPEGASAVSKRKIEATSIISYKEAYEHIMSGDMSKYKSQINTSIHRTGFKAFKHALFGPPKMHKELLQDRENVFCCAQCSFSNDDPQHIRMLQTIYKRLTGSKFDCQRYGSHWEQIGFQGNDPSTDLRGCGMLGLMQLLYMLTNPKYLPLGRDIYKLSLHETQNFPLCVMGINVTRISIQALREDSLNKECNKERSAEESEGVVFSVLNQFYTATFYKLYTVWKNGHKTIADTGFVLKDVEAYVRKNPSRAINELQQHLHQQKQIGTHTSNNIDDVEIDEPITFTKFNET